MNKKPGVNYAVRAGIVTVAASLQRVCTQRTLDLFHANESSLFIGPCFLFHHSFLSLFWSFIHKTLPTVASWGSTRFSYHQVHVHAGVFSKSV